MTPVADSSLADAVTPADLIAQVRQVRTRREAAERDQLRLALLWAEAHEVEGPARPDAVADLPAGPGLDETLAGLADAEAVDELLDRSEWRGLPELTWDSPAPFAAALGLTTRGGRAVLRRALTLAHRMPRIQTLWHAGRVECRVARQVADAVAGQPDDVCAWIDATVAARIRHSRVIGPVVLDRLLDEALIELHAEEQELKREEELRARYARIGSPDGKPDHLGLAEFVIRGDWPDITAFNDTVSAIAEAIRRSDRPDGCEPLDVRRSIAVGILADPATALALLDPEAPSVVSRQQRVLVAFHLAGDAVSGAPGGLFVRRDGALVDVDGRPWLGTAISDWMGRPDTTVTVRPVLHCGGCADCETHCANHADPQARHAYRPTDLDKEQLALREPHCVFPYCSTPARRSDCDHVVPFDPVDPSTTPTCPLCNLAPLCRHHHRLKTFSGWTYRRLEPGVFTWREPHGQRFLTTRWGTTDTTREPCGPDQARSPASWTELARLPLGRALPGPCG